MQRVCVSVRVSVYIIIVHSLLHRVLFYILWSCMKLKESKLPKHWEIEWNLNLENGDELELSKGMKHKMVSEAICDDNEVLGNEDNIIWRDVKKKCMLTNHDLWNKKLKAKFCKIRKLAPKLVRQKLTY